MSLQVAQTILEQLGGRRFMAMTGAKQFVGLESGLQFSLPNGFARQGINKVRIVLDQDDTYTVEFFKIRGVKVQEIKKTFGVYADMLQEMFKEETGLDTHL